MQPARTDYRKRLADIRAEAAVTTAMITQGRSSLFEHLAKSREIITTSRELLARADALLARR